MKMSESSILQCETLHDLVKHPDWKGFGKGQSESKLYERALEEIEECGSLSPTLALTCLNNLESEHLEVLMKRIKGGCVNETKG